MRHEKLSRAEVLTIARVERHMLDSQGGRRVTSSVTQAVGRGTVVAEEEGFPSHAKVLCALSEVEDPITRDTGASLKIGLVKQVDDASPL